MGLILSFSIFDFLLINMAKKRTNFLNMFLDVYLLSIPKMKAKTRKAMWWEENEPSLHRLKSSTVLADGQG